MKTAITLNVNGETHETAASPNQTLLEILRDSLALTGTKKGCDTGACGACTVLVDGEPYLSCILLAVDAVGKKITTIEGLGRNQPLHPLQQAFIDHGAVQCGFCTPGMILTAKALLDADKAPTAAGVRKKMAGNLCRCGGYNKVVAAVLSAAEKTASKKDRQPTDTELSGG